MNKLGDYPVWLFMFIGQIVLPMLGCASVAIKILVKNGKDMQRQLLGVGAKPGKFEGKQKEVQMVLSHNMAERMILEVGLAFTRTMINVQTDKGNHHGGQAANQDSVQVPVQSGLNNLANLPGLVPGV